MYYRVVLPRDVFPGGFQPMLPEKSMMNMASGAMFVKMAISSA
jgi:hypothetical protein